ncbi:MAG TPA: NAD(P)-binding domain-containing protein, partial [Rhizomicrobium sp.]|nr:NAD(P)-binding domain-containing protein [Rhizomicrobium sp.]
MKIGIIGTGNIGGNLTRRFRQLGHEVAIANSRGPQTLSALAAETGATAVTVKEAARGRDLVVITIPEAHIKDLPKDLFAGASKDLVVVDTGNYYPRNRDGRIAGIEDGLTESEWVEREIGRPVIKVFNNMYADHLLKRGLPKGAPGRLALPVAGDDKKHKEIVMTLVEQMGFDAVDAGPLNQSWRQQPDTPVYGKDLDAEGTRR